jgi:hypothetical protein
VTTTEDLAERQGAAGLDDLKLTGGVVENFNKKHFFSLDSGFKTAKRSEFVIIDNSNPGDSTLPTRAECLSLIHRRGRVTARLQKCPP